MTQERAQVLQTPGQEDGRLGMWGVWRLGLGGFGLSWGGGGGVNIIAPCVLY